MIGSAQQPQHPPIPGTPAPTPPASPVPKPKKQQFQTDQTRPFVLPFSPANAGPTGKPRVVPQSIDEASELYKKNIRVSTELWQTFKLREEFMADESGISRAEKVEEALKQGEDGNGMSKAEVNKLSRRLSTLVIEDEDGEDNEDDELDPLEMLKRLEKEFREEEENCRDEKVRKILVQRREDVQRLERIEILYVSDRFNALRKD